MTDSDGMFLAPHPCWLGELASCLSVVFQDTQPPQKAHPNTLPWSRESCTLHLCSQRATFQKDKAYLKTVWGFSRASICCFFNKANKEKYYFALLIFFFLLCVYVRAFERAVGYVAQAGPLAALPRLHGAESQKHRTPTVVGWLQVPVEAGGRCRVGAFLSHCGGRGRCRVGVFLRHCAPFMATGTLVEPCIC